MLVAGRVAAALAAKHATTTISIVLVAPPISSGAGWSPASRGPGGNITGVSFRSRAGDRGQTTGAAQRSRAHDLPRSHADGEGALAIPYKSGGAGEGECSTRIRPNTPLLQCATAGGIHGVSLPRAHGRHAHDRCAPRGGASGKRVSTTDCRLCAPAPAAAHRDTEESGGSGPPALLWAEPACHAAARRRVGRQDSVRGHAGRPAGGAAHAVRAGHQPQDRQGARDHDSPNAPLPGRRGDPIGVRDKRGQAHLTRGPFRTSGMQATANSLRSCLAAAIGGA